jgi:hypothetical protein
MTIIAELTAAAKLQTERKAQGTENFACPSHDQKSQHELRYMAPIGFRAKTHKFMRDAILSPTNINKN